MNLTSRVALITGTRRVGGTVAEALAAHGADVAIAYNRSKTEAEDAAVKVRALGRRAVVLSANLSQPADCEQLVQETERQLGRLDALVNMASLYPNVPFDQLTVQTWDDQMAVDLRASFLCAKAAVPLMRKQGGGRIINFSDWLPRSERPRYKGFLTYYVAKAGVKALTEALALELAADQILVNAIAPVRSRRRPRPRTKNPKEVEKATPLGRWGGAEEIAKIVLALVDSTVTGETIRADGGRHPSWSPRDRRHLHGGLHRLQAPVSSLRSRSETEPHSPSPCAPKSRPGTHPMRPCLIGNSDIAHDSECDAPGSGDRQRDPPSGTHRTGARWGPSTETRPRRRPRRCRTIRDGRRARLELSKKVVRSAQTAETSALDERRVFETV
jgi:NAD(P)-dependent dehydrogenase (short-subunit alcohol dehydrogenase family)